MTPWLSVRIRIWASLMFCASNNLTASSTATPSAHPISCCSDCHPSNHFQAAQQPSHIKPIPQFDEASIQKPMSTCSPLAVSDLETEGVDSHADHQRRCHEPE